MSDMQQFLYDGSWVFEWTGITDPGPWTADTHMEPWCKSWVRGAQFIDILLVGAGAGGGWGTNKSVGGVQAGAGSGGSAGIVKARFNLETLPEVIYMHIPQGGRGGTSAAGTGGAGGCAGIFLKPGISNPTVNQTVLVSGSSDATGGQANGTAGGAAGVVLIGNCLFAALATGFVGLAGIAGAAGGTGGGSQSNTFRGVMAGAPGAGSNGASTSSGGQVNPSGTVLLPVSLGGAGGVTPGRGADGMLVRDGAFMWASTGGAGGGSTNTAATDGGNGGNGGPGSGGGGGGVGTQATGGNGGNGGDAYMLLIAS